MQDENFIKLCASTMDNTVIHISGLPGHWHVRRPFKGIPTHRHVPSLEQPTDDDVTREEPNQPTADTTVVASHIVLQ